MNPIKLWSYDCAQIIEFFEKQMLNSGSAYPGAFHYTMLEPLRITKYMSSILSNSLKEMPLYVDTIQSRKDSNQQG